MHQHYMYSKTSRSLRYCRCSIIPRQSFHFDAEDTGPAYTQRCKFNTARVRPLDPHSQAKFSFSRGHRTGVPVKRHRGEPGHTRAGKPVVVWDGK